RAAVGDGAAVGDRAAVYDRATVAGGYASWRRRAGRGEGETDPDPGARRHRRSSRFEGRILTDRRRRAEGAAAGVRPTPRRAGLVEKRDIQSILEAAARELVFPELARAEEGDDRESRTRRAPSPTAARSRASARRRDRGPGWPSVYRSRRARGR